MASPNHLRLEQKYSFVQLAGEDDSAFAEGCRAFRISRPTGSKWLGRYDEAGSLGWRNNPAVRTIPARDRGGLGGTIAPGASSAQQGRWQNWRRDYNEERPA